jgi:hypothetical protein
VDADGWTIIPIHDTIATTHLIALRNDDELRTTDIDTVVYIRAASGWDAEAYGPSVTKEDAMVHLANELGLSDPLALDWELGLDAGDLTGVAPTRAAFGKGFFASDPLYAAAAAMDDPEPLATLVETMGGASASSAVNTSTITPVGDPIPGGGGGGPGCVVAPHDTIAASVDRWIDGTFASFEAAATQAIGDFYASSNCCWPWTYYRWESAWSPWSCGPWTGPISGPFSNGSIYYCRFQRTASRSKTRTAIKVCANCSMVIWQQTKTETGTQITSEPTPNNSSTNCGSPSGVTSPGSGCVPTGPTQYSGWLPGQPQPC